MTEPAYTPQRIAEAEAVRTVITGCSPAFEAALAAFRAGDYNPLREYYGLPPVQP